MDHNQSTNLMAVEKYLLEELTPDVRDEFEEHFFDCEECATDLQATAAFMAAARQEFKANPVPKPGKAAKGKSLSAAFWPAAAVCACGVSSPGRLSKSGGLSALQNRDRGAQGSGDFARHLPCRGQQSRGPNAHSHCGSCASFPLIS
jgi:hypothetical protein